MPFVLTIAGLLFAFGFITQEVTSGRTSAFDRKLILALRSSTDPAVLIGPAWLLEAARDITSLGSIAVLVMLTLTVAGYLFLAGKHMVMWLMLLAVFGGMALNSLLKFAFARVRPDFVPHGAKVFTMSFPSGHAALSAIAYLTIGALLARSQPSAAIGLYFMVLAALLTALIGLSRVYLGVHYPTDVFAGWCIGAAWAIACWVVVAHLQDHARPLSAL